MYPELNLGLLVFLESTQCLLMKQNLCIFENVHHHVLSKEFWIAIENAKYINLLQKQILYHKKMRWVITFILVNVLISSYTLL